MEQLYLKLLDMSITASWLVIAVVIFRVVFRKAPKSITCLLWALVAVRLVCPFSVESVLSIIPRAQNTPTLHDSAISTGISTVNQFVSGSLSSNVSDSADPIQLIIFIASVIWLVGTAAMLIYALVSYVRVRRRVKESVILRDNVWVCDRVESPFVLGVFSPRVYLPSTINEADIDYAVSHEDAHIKRRDYIWKPIGFLLLSVYWFNPIMWVAYILVCRDIEFACDERVLNEKGTGIKKPYSQALISCSIRSRSLAACPLAFGEVGVKRRVKNVLNYKKPAIIIVVLALLAVAVTAVCLMTNPKGETVIPAGRYSIVQEIYMDGAFSYYMVPEDAPSIEIDEKMDVYEWKEDELISGGLFKSTKLNDDNFNSLFNGTELWANDESTDTVRKNNHCAWIMNWTPQETGIYPYMILQQKDNSLYIVYANVENGEAECVRWIYGIKGE